MEAKFPRNSDGFAVICFHQARIWHKTAAWHSELRRQSSILA